jgi:hypothetical protein
MPRARLLELVHHAEGVTGGFGGQGAAHEQADVQGLGDLRVGRTQVEDLLDSVIDSVEAVLRNGHRQRRQLLVFAGQRPLSEHPPAQLPEGGVHLHGGLEHQAIQSLPLRLSFMNVHGVLSYPVLVVISVARVSA